MPNVKGDHYKAFELLLKIVPREILWPSEKSGSFFPGALLFLSPSVDTQDEFLPVADLLFVLSS
jgi:hypothetical protein